MCFLQEMEQDIFGFMIHFIPCLSKAQQGGDKRIHSFGTRPAASFRIVQASSVDMLDNPFKANMIEEHVNLTIRRRNINKDTSYRKNKGNG
ncbi:MAG: hypothetical protein EZS28_001676 [Streblomastix strix]|uniref:Uncharacterized protein n=1 Tax=Streblomastix strix TaxID=222440 RepID=A0A5J4X7T7_9EUKA|nr:MAG: hypothetical protein EZS28_001676 [Streblomastix strix]